MDKIIKRHLQKRGVAVTKPPRGSVTFSERNPDFFRWFYESVMGFDSDEYRREFWREARKTGHTIGHVPYGIREYQRRRDSRLEGAAIAIELLAGGCALAIWLIRRIVDRHIQRLRRPSYYETERARRIRLTEERRHINKRRTLNPMPVKEELLDAFRKAKNSPSDMIRFGSLLEDLECYVDNSVYFKDGRLVGRRGGIRRHLEREVPELYARYKTVMKYKVLSKKFRQALGVEDPISASSLLPKDANSTESKCDENSFRREIPRSDEMEVLRSEIEVGKAGIQASAAAVEASGAGIEDIEARMEDLMSGIEARKDRARVILEACEGSIVSLAAQLALRIDPNYTPHASRPEYRRMLADAVSSKQGSTTAMHLMRHGCV